LIAVKGQEWLQDKFLHPLTPVTIIALLTTLVLLFRFNGEVIQGQRGLPSELADGRPLSFLRIFPLLELGAKRSRHLNKGLESLSAQGYAMDIVPVSYEFQRGGNQMLVLEKIETSE
jgi:hypothetical protein